jgi:hypothetical protein
MHKRILFLSAFLVGAIFLLPGCARNVIVSEALQLPEGAKIYTRCNIWYQDPDDISAVNYHTGNILPFGTEVEEVEADMGSVTIRPFLEKSRGSVAFKVKKTGQEFYISYDETWMMIPMEEYLRRIFSDKPQKDLAKGIKSSIYEKIIRGIVEEGMTRKEVLLAYGYPVVHRTPSLLEDTWVYWDAKMNTARVIFKKDKVTAILKIGNVEE